MKKTLCTLLTAMLFIATFTACGGPKNYADGTYTATSSVYENDDGTDEGNGYGEVSVTIKDNAIVDCTFQTYKTDGTLKDTDYGKEDGEVANRDYYNKAQKAVAACDQYASMLLQNGQLPGIDAISGATVNYDQFCEAVSLALKQAETDK